MFMKPLIASGLVIAALVVGGGRLARQGKSSVTSPDIIAGPTETAVFSGGCFWGLQAAFDKLPGVISTRVGYTGGHTSNPTYEQVAIGTTGHAEAVEVVFDPARVTYEEVVRYFFRHHRFTGAESEASYRKRPYRSEIFVNNDEQRKTADRVRSEFVGKLGGVKKVATLIDDAGRFWEAEAEHQMYLSRCGS